MSLPGRRQNMSYLASLSRFPVRCMDTVQGVLQYRQAGEADRVTHVLLHGIGSGSASWVEQLRAAEGRADLRLLAWEAPGYGESTPVASAVPVASDYAAHLWAWLDALGMDSPVLLAGHSLGCLIAASAAAQHPQRVERLFLLSPARGYGDAPQAEREEKLQSRLSTLQRLGPEGMAAARASAMLSPSATAAQIDAVRQTMSQVRVSGYTQASYLLANGVLARDLAQLRCPLVVASGAADTITPPAACQQVAQQAGVGWQDLGAVGHACALQAPEAVNALLGLVRSPTPETTA